MSNLANFIGYSFIGAIVFLCVYTIWTYQGGSSTFNPINSIKMNTAELEDNNLNLGKFEKNSSGYLGKNVSATGKLVNYLLFSNTCKSSGGHLYSLKDSEGYEIIFCPMNRRELPSGKVYTIRGIIQFDNNLKWGEPAYYLQEG